MCSTYIIIVTYNGEQWIRECLNSCSNFNVIVVDNNSSDNTIAIIKNEYSNVVLLKQKKNLGFGQANNLGISYALKNSCDYVFLLNQDAYLKDDCIERLISVHLSNTNYGVLSPIHLNGNQSKLDLNFKNYVSKNNDFLNHHILNLEKKAVYPVAFVNAAAWLLPIKTLRKVGGFDPIFFHYGEDDNYCQRVSYYNLKIGVVSDAYIIHDREFRESKKDLDSNEPQKKCERFFKVQLANVNSNYSKTYKYLFKSSIKKVIFSVLKFKPPKEGLNNILVLKNIKKEVLSSINKNTKRSNFLYLTNKLKTWLL